MQMGSKPGTLHLLPPEQLLARKSVRGVPSSVLGCADHWPPRGSFSALLAPPPLPVAIPSHSLDLGMPSALSLGPPVLFP